MDDSLHTSLVDYKDWDFLTHYFSDAQLLFHELEKICKHFLFKYHRYLFLKKKENPTLCLAQKMGYTFLIILA